MTCNLLLPSKEVQHTFQFRTYLLDDLLTLVGIIPGLITGKTLPGTTNSKPLFVEQTADLADQYHIMTLIITAVTPALQWFQLGKFLLPIAQDMWFDCTEVTDLSDSKIAFTRYCRQFNITRCFQHMPLLAPLISAQDGR